MGAVLDVVTRTGGVTKGRIAEEVPPEANADLDADALVHVLRVLELYDAILSGSGDRFELDAVGREATPSWAMKLGIRLYRTVSSYSNTISELEMFGV